ncbi:hypothetical protein ACWI47_12270, partial [Ursidibacter arcticus]
GNLTVEKDSVLKGNATIEKDLTVNGTSNLKDTNVNGNLTVEKDSVLKGNATIEKDLTVNGTSNLKDTNVNGNLTVEKDSVLKGNATIEKDLTVNGTSNLKDTNVNGNLTVEKDSVLKGNATIEKDLTVNGTSNLKDTNVNGNLTVTGNQGVDGNSTIKGNQTIEKDLTVNGTSNLKDTNVNGDLTVTNGNTTLGNTTVGGQGQSFTIANGTTVDMGGNKVANITSGEIKAGDNNAVTGDVVNTKVQELIDSGIKFGGNEGDEITTKLGSKLNIIGGAKTEGEYSSNNVRTQTDGSGNVTIEFADKPVFNGLDMSNQKITRVGDGDISPNSTDAVNGRQIFALTGGQGAPDVAANYTTTITNPDGSKTELTHQNVVVDENGKPVLVTYNVQDQKEHVTNSVITAINNMNTQGIKFFHTNDGTAKSARPADQAENTEDSSASGAYATAVGYRATASGERAIAFGHNATVTGTDSISIGTGNIVNGNNSGAFGDPSIVNATKSYSVGNNNLITEEDQRDVFVFGNNVTKTESNSVFLGTQSGYVAEGETTKGNSAHTSQTIAGETYQYAGGEASQVKGVVSVGNVAQDGTMETRRIQNVAPGLISAKSTDAINGSQLYALNDNIQNKLGDLNVR